MKRQKKFGALLSLLLFANLGMSGCNDEGLKVNLSEKQIEGAMASYFPYHKEALMGTIQLDLMKPDLILTSGSERAVLALQTQVKALGSTWPGKLRLSFGLDYDAGKGTFYLVSPKIDGFEMAGLPQKLSDSVVQNLLPLVQTYLTRVPVYTLKAEGSTAQNMAKSTLKKMAIKDGSLQIILGVP